MILVSGLILCDAPMNLYDSSQHLGGLKGHFDRMFIASHLSCDYGVLVQNKNIHDIYEMIKTILYLFSAPFL